MSILGSSKPVVTIILHSSELSGGAELSMLETAELLRESYEVTFIIRKPQRGLQKLLKEKGFVSRAIYFTAWAQIDMPTDTTTLQWRKTKNKQAVTEIQQVLGSFNTDIVISNTSVVPWGALAAARLGLKHVWYLREYCDPAHGYGFLLPRESIYHDIETLSDAVFVNSQQLKKYIDSLLKAQHSHVFLNPIDVDIVRKQSQEAVKNPFSNQQAIKLITVGAINKSKGQYAVIQAIDMLNKKGIATEYCLVGEPSTADEAQHLQTLISRMNHPGAIHLLGKHANPHAYTQSADIGVSMSDKEAFGRTTIEYMALDKPVIGHRSGATQDLIADGISGRLVASFKPADIAEAIAMYQDTTILHAHSKQASVQLKKIYSADLSAGAIAATLQEVVYAKKSQTAIQVYLDAPIQTTISLRVLPHKAKLLLRSLYLRFF